MMPKELPAVQWLGRTLNLITMTPFDIETVSEIIKNNPAVFKIDTRSNNHVVDIGGVQYSVPACVSVSQDATSTSNSYVTYPNGLVAHGAFGDPSACLRYLAISLDRPSISLSRNFHADDQFAFFSFSHQAYLAALAEYAELLDEDALGKALAPLPEQFTPSDDVISGYKDFFREFGTHVVMNVSYGGRYQLIAWASTEDQKVNNNFARDVTASMHGITTSGTFDPAAHREKQYATFQRLEQQLISIQGGDPDLKVQLAGSPADYAKYKEWVASIIKAESDLINVYVSNLWNILREADSRGLRQHAQAVQDAYEYILAHPAKYRTTVRFDVEAAWAEFGLGTPSADVVFKRTPVYFPRRDIVWSSTRMRLEEQHGAKKTRTVTFSIVNDGSPIDIYLSSGIGTARITIEGETFSIENTGIGAAKTERFYQVRVSSVLGDDERDDPEDAAIAEY